MGAELRELFEADRQEEGVGRDARKRRDDRVQTRVELRRRERAVIAAARSTNARGRRERDARSDPELLDRTECSAVLVTAGEQLAVEVGRGPFLKTSAFGR